MEKAFRWRGIALAAVLVGCVSHAEQGNKAAAVGDWKAAVESYRLALQTEDSSAELRRRYAYAVGQAIAQSLAVARRCEAERDTACVEQETSYVLALDPGNAEAPKIRAASNSRAAKSQLEAARESARRGKYRDAYEALAQSAKLTDDGTIAAEAAKVRAVIAPAAAAYAESLLQQSEGMSQEQQVERLAASIALLELVVLDLPDKAELLAQARGRHEAVAAARQKQIEAAHAQEVAAERERNRSRTVSVTGALIGLGKADGTQWDGMGDKVTSEAADALATAMNTMGRPDVAAAAVLAGAAAGALQKPDIQGRVELWVQGKVMATVNLAKQGDTFTPQWSTARWEKVDIETARIRVVLQDADLNNNDNVGIVEVNADDLKAASAAGHVHAVRVDDQTSGQVLFLLVSVM